MNVADYFVLYVSEDGDVSLTQYESDALEARLNEHYWGEDVRILGWVPTTHQDLLEGNGHTLTIIKGEIIVPKEHTVVTEFALD